MTAPGRHLAPAAAYRQGVVSNLGNPRWPVLFTSLLPQFAPESGSRFAAFFVLGLCFCAMTAFWLIAYAFAVARAKDLFQRPRIRPLVGGLTGAVLVALGLAPRVRRAVELSRSTMRRRYRSALP